MFGFGKMERAEKALRSALGIFLPANSRLIKEILSHSDAARSETLNEIAGGENPYRAGAFLVAAYIRHRIEESDDERKQRLLVRIFDESYNKPPPSFKLAAHMVNALAALESGKKPLLPEGSTYEFLDRVGMAFAGQAGARKHIANYMIELARRLAATEAE